MDFAFFGLTRRPFRPTPDTEAFVPLPAHAAAVAGLRAAFDDRDGFALVDGDAGVGKTVVTRKFLEGLPADTPTVLVPASRFARPADLFQAVLFDLGKPYTGMTEQELRLAVTEHLLGTLSAGGVTAVVLDEAHHLTADLAEEVRLLGNIESRAAKAAFVVLVGHGGLRDRFATPAFAPLAQRIAVRHRLDPLDRESAARFLWQQLRAAGGDPAALVTDDALNLLTAHAGGIPRVLNQAAAAAFALARQASQEEVDVEAMSDALAQLGLLPDEVAAEPAGPQLMQTAGKKPTKRKAA